MSHIPFTIAAYILNGVAVTVDKFLLVKHIPDPLVYVFYFSIVSLIALALIPFADQPSLNTFILASASTLLWTSGAYFMFKALQTGSVSRVIPIIGTLIPIFLLIYGVTNAQLNNTQVLGILTLTFGLIFLTFTDWKGAMKPKELLLETSSATLFAISYITLRQAYLSSNFWTVFVYSRPILIPVGLALLLIPSTRKVLLPKKPDTSSAQKPYWKTIFGSKTSLLFATGQLAAGVSELLLTFSVSMANPALVNSLQGVQYAFLFTLSLILAKKMPEVFKESFSAHIVLQKFTGIAFIAIGLFMVA